MSTEKLPLSVIADLNVRSIDLITATQMKGLPPAEVAAEGDPMEGDNISYSYTAKLTGATRYEDTVFFSCKLTAGKANSGSGIFHVTATYYGLIDAAAIVAEEDVLAVARLGVRFAAWSRFKNLYGFTANQADVAIQPLLDDPLVEDAIGEDVDQNEDA